MRIFKKFILWLPVLSIIICVINQSGSDDKNLLLFLTSPPLLWLNPWLTDLHYSMENERMLQLILYGIHFGTAVLIGLMADWFVSRFRSK
jgi:NhaP-type Na+/H+ or K+/H+ antiporter